MSQTSSGFNSPQRTTQGPLGAAYIPTEDEKRVFRECNRESFWYRSLPLSAIAIAVTQVMVSRGVLSPSPRFGSLPKVAFAGLFGYMGGKLSYMKTCQEKFKNLENSPLGEALRQGNLRHVRPEMKQSEFEDPNSAAPQQPGFEAASQPTEKHSSHPNPYTSPYQEEDGPKKKAVLYEELRSKNRENYEVTLTQKAETLLKPQAEVTAPKKEVQTNKYGDTWEE
ncbi:OCIA domain-containing protein 1 isoform X2 [Hoplias malabaricus]|uniref:OCIA domain-containing protein 1 isoform X2 n=1 Tax=Hoplias malabaricus TaxID=27720 RepID=UPI003461E80B